MRASIRWDGRASLSVPLRRALRGSQISMMFQDPAISLDPLMRLGKQSPAAARRHRPARCRPARGHRARARRSRPARPHAHAPVLPVRGLGGQRQRAPRAGDAAARPPCSSPTSFTTALFDVTNQRTVLDLLDEVTRERGVSLLFISHDLPVVARMADRVIVVDAGRITDDVSVEVIRSAPDALRPAYPSRPPRAHSTPCSSVLAPSASTPAWPRA